MNDGPKRRTMDVLVIDSIGSSAIPRRHPKNESWDVVAMSGLVETAEIAGEYEVDGQDHREIDAIQLSGATGEWMALLRSQQASRYGYDFLLQADYFGFGRIHYALIPSKDFRGRLTLVASLTQRGVLGELKRRGAASADVNWDVVLPHIISDVAMFRTRSSDRTFSPQINVLPRSATLLAGPQGFGLCPRPQPSFEGLTYHQLIDRGIDGAIRDSQLAASSSESHVLGLSGGRDSRALLAMFVAGGLHSQIEILSDRPTRIGSSADVFRRDLHLASQMVDHFDLNWRVSGHGTVVESSFEEILNDTMDSRGNEVFEVAPAKHLIQNRQETSFMGMGGEYYRSYIGAGYQKGFATWWENAGKTSESTAGDLGNLYLHLVKNQRIPEGLYSASSLAFVNAMTITDGDVIDQLEKSFDEYRSRCHAGNVEWMRVGGTKTLYPLARPEFEAASRLLSEKDYEHGRVVFDIIEQTCPSLNALPLEAKPWPADFSTAGASSVWDAASVSRATQKYDHARKAIPPQQRVARDLRPFDFHKEAFDRLGDIIDGWRTSMPTDWYNPIVERAARYSVKSQASLRSLLIVAESVQDVLDPPQVSSRIAYCVAGEGTIEYRLLQRAPLRNGSLEVLSPSKDFRKEVSAVDVSEVAASLVVDQQAGTAQLSLRGLNVECEVAVYLYADGQMVVRSHYLSSPHIKFEHLDSQTSINRATVFIRWRGDIDATRVFDVSVNNRPTD